MSSGVASDDFVRQMTRCQDRLYAYLRTLLPYGEAAREVLQETNVVLLRKADELAEINNFDAWACRIAYFEALAYRRNFARDRLLFDDELLGQLAQQAAQSTGSPDRRAAALDDCLSHLSAGSRELLTARYAEQRSVQQLAKTHGRPAPTIATQLFRIRRKLLDCVMRKLSVETAT
jgi:RNA polymerase sigma-70 factor (ECF subfamily)